MSIASFALCGLAVGFAIAAAIGPIGLLCIRRTIAEGRAIGLASGLGAVTADAAYASVAAFGLTTISDLLVAERRPLGVAGGAALFLLAARTWWRRAAEGPWAGDEAGVGELPPGTCPPRTRRLPLDQPRRASLSPPASRRPGSRWPIRRRSSRSPPRSWDRLVGRGGPDAAALVLGVFCGSAAWWLLLVAAVGALRPRLGPRPLRRVSAASAVLIAALGALAIAGSLARA